MKVLEIGDHPMSNSEVRDFIKQKRQQHQEEDAEDKAKGLDHAQRAKNYLESLKKHESYLNSDALPYKKNPSAYEGLENNDKSLKAFSNAQFEKVQVPLAEKYRSLIRQKVMSVKDAQDELGEWQEKKELSEMELLTIHNLAPANAEMLQPMIESWEERFSNEEMEAMAEAIMEVYRAEEAKSAEESGGDAGVEELTEQLR